MNEKICRTAQQLADECGLSRYTISAMRKAGRRLLDPLPNYASVSDVRRWLRKHPDFVARREFKTSTPPCSSTNPAPGVAGKSGESPRPRGRRTPSPATSEHPLEQVA